MQYFRILSIFVLAFIISGCVASKQPEKPAWGGSEEWRLKSLEENFLNFKEGMREQNHQIERNHNETTAQIEKLQDRMSEFDNILAELKENQQKMMTMKVEEDITPEGTTEDVVMGGSESSEEKPWMNVPGENTAAAGTVTAGADNEPASSLSGDALYQEGVRLVMNDKPLEARALLNQYLKDNGSSKLAPNALYWIGETFYSEKSFAQSILKFKEVGRRFPKAGKVPDAMLKIGLAYDKLGDRENSVFYLRTLLEDYPKSDPAKIGRSRLREIEG
ncbi:tetratricopeptide repeat protein [Maridesulfovibrio hydrothermalis]|uniref:Tol-pal system protein YbgF n=1 Tax=Maridesulfovibrio hydrothermalis AM13 = DSM 14728 TaxID=1121451 RepID=L0REU4_9BACT|nr:tetratricopeptide repeat protein [Maridesulfovibrio hydrothermalis]CCO24071.1 Tol-pal system protein YbgF [Maridesulfovibrio hydrothermalis AM13 = DSM 14728]